MVKKSAKIILFDVLGILSILGGLLLSPLPGPWTIPLYILGLSLLGKNHHWPKRMFIYLEEKSEDILPAKYAKYIIPLTGLLFVLISLLFTVIFLVYIK